MVAIGLLQLRIAIPMYICIACTKFHYHLTAEPLIGIKEICPHYTISFNSECTYNYYVAMYCM